MKSNKSTYLQKPGFKIPEDYFGNFEEKMMAKLEKQDSLSIPAKNHGFSVPDDYFDSLEEKIVAKTHSNKTKVIHLVKKEYVFYAAAVAAIFVLMLGDFFKTGVEQPLGWDDIEVSAMESYIDEGYDFGYFDLNSSELGDFVFENGKLIDDSDFTTVNSDAAFEYIDENMEDPAYILE